MDKKGAYLNLWVMLKNGKIETRIFSKSEPIYLNPDSCHDSSVFKSIFTGVGLSLRLNCSKDKDFDKAVKKYSSAFAASLLVTHTEEQNLNSVKPST